MNEGIKWISEGLISNKSVLSLDLKRNEIGDDGAKSISQMLLKNDTISYIDLGCNFIYLLLKFTIDNDITDNGAIYLSDSLKFNKNINYIDFLSKVFKININF